MPTARPSTTPNEPFDPASHRHAPFCADPGHADGTEHCHSEPVTITGAAAWATDTESGPQAFFDARPDGLCLTGPGVLAVIGQLQHLYRLLTR